MASKTLVQSLFGTVRALEKCKSQFVSVSAFRNASTYRAAVCREHGKPLVLEDVPRTTLGEEEVRLRVHAAAVNVKDVACCVTGTGHRYLFDGKEPFVPGFEACGEVLEVGSKVKKFKVGERVICLNHSTLGGFAEECVASLPDCWAIDQDILFDKGAALLESYATALLSFGHRHRLKGGDKEVIMVTAAAGGLGLAALDVAANVFKTKVIAICTTEERSSEVRDLGAWASLVYDHKHLVSKVKEVTDGHGVDVVYEAVGGQVFETALQCVKHEGTVIVAAFASGKVPRIAAHQLFPNAPTLTGVSLPHYRQKNPKLFRHMCNEAVELLTRKLISPRISHEFPLSQVNEAVAMFSDTTRTGKILVMPSMKEKEVVEEGKKEGEGDGQKPEKEKKAA